jgi:hypothetical protein
MQNLNHRVTSRAGCTALALLACAALAAPAAQARSASSTVLVPPASLPAQARQPGEAMFLQDTLDGRTMLYIQRDGDGGMAVLDVTDPAHIKGQASVPLDAPAASHRDDPGVREWDGGFDVPAVRAQVANSATGTTFLLTDGGLYVVRQPSTEMIRKLRELNYAN